MATEIHQQTVTTRFEHARNGHNNKIFYQPLYYISNNLSQSILQKNSSNDFKKEMLDEKIQFFPETDIKFEMTLSESISPENNSIENSFSNIVIYKQYIDCNGYNIDYQIMNFNNNLDYRKKINIYLKKLKKLKN